MQIIRKKVRLQKYKRGFHLITAEVQQAVPELSSITAGMANIFLRHTSASLSVNENADPSVRSDMEHFFNDLADDKHYYIHTYEGDDDMPAHIKCSLLGNSLSIPVTDGKLDLGVWQGIYLGEHRDAASGRELVITIWGV